MPAGVSPQRIVDRLIVPGRLSFRAEAANDDHETVGRSAGPDSRSDVPSSGHPRPRTSPRWPRARPEWGRAALMLRFTEDGAARIRQVSRDLVGQRMVIEVDGQVVSHHPGAHRRRRRHPPVGRLHGQQLDSGRMAQRIMGLALGRLTPADWLPAAQPGRGQPASPCRCGGRVAASARGVLAGRAPPSAPPRAAAAAPPARPSAGDGLDRLGDREGVAASAERRSSAPRRTPAPRSRPGRGCAGPAPSAREAIGVGRAQPRARLFPAALAPRLLDRVEVRPQGLDLSGASSTGGGASGGGQPAAGGEEQREDVGHGEPPADDRRR